MREAFGGSISFSYGTPTDHLVPHRPSVPGPAAQHNGNGGRAVTIGRATKARVNSFTTVHPLPLPLGYTSAVRIWI